MPRDTRPSLDRDNILQHIAEVAEVLDEANVPEEGRYLHIPEDMQRAIQGGFARAQRDMERSRRLYEEYVNGVAGLNDRLEEYDRNLQAAIDNIELPDIDDPDWVVESSQAMREVIEKMVEEAPENVFQPCPMGIII